MTPARPLEALCEGMELLARIALLFSDGPVSIPAPGLFETEAGLRVVERFESAAERGQISSVGGGTDPLAFAERKLQHFPGADGEVTYGHLAPKQLRFTSQSWRAKSASTDRDLSEGWRIALEEEEHPLLDLAARSSNPFKAADAIYDIPERLEGKAIIGRNIVGALPANLRYLASRQDALTLKQYLARGFYRSYAVGNAKMVLEMPGFPAPAALMPEEISILPVPRLARMLNFAGLHDLLLQELEIERLLAFADTAEWRALASAIVDRVERGEEWSVDEILALSRVRRRPRRSYPLIGSSSRFLSDYVLELLRALRLSEGATFPLQRQLFIGKAEIGTLINIENLHGRQRGNDSKTENTAQGEKDTL